MKYPVYERYKDSGVEWLGEIPEDWSVERLFDITSIKTSNVDKKTVEGQSPVKLCNYTDVYYNEKIHSGLEFMSSSASEMEIKRYRLSKDDVIITKDSESPFDIGISSHVVDDIEDLICGYHLAIIKPMEPCLSGPFLYFALSSDMSAYQFCIAANGVTRFGLSYNAMKNIKIPIPSTSEQKFIADFLDQKTAQIDRLIEKKQALIEKLNEKRTALITRAVTKGLDESLPMKDSGVEWLGEVPANWEVAKLRWFIRTSSGDFISNNDLESERSDLASIPVIGGNGVMAYTTYYNKAGGALIVGRVGAHCGNVHLIEEACWVTDNALLVSIINHEFDINYLFWLLNLTLLR